MPRITRPLLVAVAILGCCTGRAGGDVIVLDDGATLDGKVFKEDAGVLWVKTLKGVQKLAADKVKSRTPGESAVEKYDKLLAAVQGDVVTAAGLWDLYSFQKEHAADLPPETAKENLKLLPRILKKDPQHAGAHTELGEVDWQGKWVKQSEIPRLQEEAAREKLRTEWQTRLGVPITLEQTDHFLLLDNTGEKDLSGRGKALEKAHDDLKKVLGLTQLFKDRAVIVTIKNYDAYCTVLDGFAGEAAINPTIVRGGQGPRDRRTLAPASVCIPGAVAVLRRGGHVVGDRPQRRPSHDLDALGCREAARVDRRGHGRLDRDRRDGPAGQQLPRREQEAEDDAARRHDRQGRQEEEGPEEERRRPRRRAQPVQGTLQAGDPGRHVPADAPVPHLRRRRPRSARGGRGTRTRHPG